MGKVATQHLPPQGVYLIGMLGYLPVAGFLLAAQGVKIPWHPWGWGAAFGAGLSTAVGLFCFFRALALGKAALVVPLTAMYPVVTVVLSWLFLKESITLRHLAGVVLALVAVWLLSE
jgi:transporter family protein